jgi:hypothetical protein
VRRLAAIRASVSASMIVIGRDDSLRRALRLVLGRSGSCSRSTCCTSSCVRRSN